MRENDGGRPVTLHRNDPMPPALADQHRIASRCRPKGVAEAACDRLDRSSGWVEEQDPPAPTAIQKIGRPLIDAAALRTVGRDQHAIGGSCKRVDGVEAAGKDRSRLRRRGIGIDARLASAQRNREGAAGHTRERRDRLIEGADFGRRVALETQKPRTVSEVKVGAVGRQILRRGAFEKVSPPPPASDSA